MSAVLLHGIVLDQAEAPADVPRHRRVRLGRLNALVSVPNAGENEEEQLAAALSHHHLLLGYSQTSDVLPVRYGTVFSSDERLCRHLNAVEAPITTALRTLENRREYLLTVALQRDAQVSNITAETGRGFLAAKRNQRNARTERGKQRAAFLKALMARVKELAIAAETTRPLSSERGLCVALLVNLQTAEQLHEALFHMEREASTLGLVVRLTGPGPCYSFAALPVVPNG